MEKRGSFWSLKPCETPKRICYRNAHNISLMSLWDWRFSSAYPTILSFLLVHVRSYLLSKSLGSGTQKEKKSLRSLLLIPMSRSLCISLIGRKRLSCRSQPPLLGPSILLPLMRQSRVFRRPERSHSRLKWSETMVSTLFGRKSSVFPLTVLEIWRTSFLWSSLSFKRVKAKTRNPSACIVFLWGAWSKVSDKIWRFVNVLTRRPGFRHLPLHDAQLTQHLFSTLFIQVKIRDIDSP